MSLTSTMLACRGPGPGVTAVLLVLVVCWGVAALLAIPNLVLILKLPRRMKQGQVVAFLNSLIWAGVLFAGGFNPSFLLIALSAFGIPLLVIGQFGYLLILHKRLRPQVSGG